MGGCLDPIRPEGARVEQDGCQGPSGAPRPRLSSELMRVVTFGSQSFFVGDDIADALLEYGRVLSNEHRADVLTVKAITDDGSEIDVGLLFGPNAAFVVRSTDRDLAPPDNDQLVKYINDAIHFIHRPPNSLAEGLDVEPDTYPEDWQ